MLQFSRPEPHIVAVFRRRISWKSFLAADGSLLLRGFPKVTAQFYDLYDFFCIICHEHTHPPALHIGKALQSTQTSECQVIIALLKPAKACHYLTALVLDIRVAFLFGITQSYSSFQSEGFERRAHSSCLQWRSSPVAVCLCLCPISLLSCAVRSLNAGSPPTCSRGERSLKKP